MTVYSATGRGWDMIGEAIDAARLEDASGFRRAIATVLARRDYAVAATMLRTTEAHVVDLRRRLVAEWGEP